MIWDKDRENSGGFWGKSGIRSKGNQHKHKRNGAAALSVVEDRGLVIRKNFPIGKKVKKIRVFLFCW